MHRLLAVVALGWIAISGCKKGEVENPVDPEPTPGDFVPIPLEPDSDDPMLGSELMMAVGRCGDLVALEPSAMMGKLKDGEIRCLEDSIRNNDKQTIKDKISRVLMADAWAKGDKHRWETIVRRHLNEFDRSDADLCYRFAQELVKRGAEHADESMHWADIALENRHQWTGDTHVQRVNALYKIRAYAAQTKWQSLEEKYSLIATEAAKTNTAVPEAVTSEKDLARNNAKTLAREWLEYAKSTGKDLTLPLQMCISAAGTSEFCNL